MRTWWWTTWQPSLWRRTEVISSRRADHCGEFEKEREREKSPSSSPRKVYDPVDGTWTRWAADLSGARWAHTAAALSDGTVIVVGGENDEGKIATAEVYDPASDTWTVVSQMVDGRSGHSMEMLPDGRLMVAGGSGPTVEVYDFNSNTWSLLPNLDRDCETRQSCSVRRDHIGCRRLRRSRGIKSALIPWNKPVDYVDRLPETRVSPTMTRLQARRTMLGGTGRPAGPGKRLPQRRVTVRLLCLRQGCSTPAGPT